MTSELRILTIRQPWASLIVSGVKDIENRSWRTSYRGRLAICAAAGTPRTESPLLADLMTPDAIQQLPRGVIIGVVTLTDCLSATPLFESRRWFEGPYGFVLTDPCVFRTPIPHRGQLWLERPSKELRQRLTAELVIAERVRRHD